MAEITHAQAEAAIRSELDRLGVVTYRSEFGNWFQVWRPGPRRTTLCRIMDEPELYTLAPSVMTGMVVLTGDLADEMAEKFPPPKPGEGSPTMLYERVTDGEIPERREVRSRS